MKEHIEWETRIKFVIFHTDYDLLLGPMYLIMDVQHLTENIQETFPV